MKNIIQFFKPPPQWRIPAAIVFGAIIGLGIYTFKISNAASYLSDSPSTCVNCHVMNSQYASWNHSAHRRFASCNDCHVPHTNVVSKYYFKAKDGARHATIFTLRNEPQVIRIKDAGISVVQENCKRCHQKMNKQVNTINVSARAAHQDEGKLCWDCHREVPHGRVNSLSSATYARVPKLGSALPEWMQKLMKKEK